MRNLELRATQLAAIVVWAALAAVFAGVAVRADSSSDAYGDSLALRWADMTVAEVSEDVAYYAAFRREYPESLNARDDLIIVVEQGLVRLDAMTLRPCYAGWWAYFRSSLDLYRLGLYYEAIQSPDVAFGAYGLSQSMSQMAAVARGEADCG